MGYAENARIEMFIETSISSELRGSDHRRDSRKSLDTSFDYFKYHVEYRVLIDLCVFES